MAKGKRTVPADASIPYLHRNTLFVTPSRAQERRILGLTAKPVNEDDVAAIADRIEGVLRDTYELFLTGFCLSDLHTVEEIRGGEWIDPDPRPAPAMIGQALNLLLDRRLVALVTEVPIGAVSPLGNADTIRVVGEASLIRCAHYQYPFAGLLPTDTLRSLEPGDWPWRGLRDAGVTAPPRFYKEGGLLDARGVKKALSANATLVRAILILFEKAGWREAPVEMVGIPATYEDRRKQMAKFLKEFPIEILPSGGGHTYWKWRED